MTRIAASEIVVGDSLQPTLMHPVYAITRSSPPIITVRGGRRYRFHEDDILEVTGDNDFGGRILRLVVASAAETDCLTRTKRTAEHVWGRD